MRLSLVCIKVRSRAGDCALRCGSLVSSLTNVLAKSLTASCLLCQIRYGTGPDECAVSRAFSCVVQLCGYFFAMFLC